MPSDVLNSTLSQIDVLVVVALEDELEAVLAEGGGIEQWRQIQNQVYVCTLQSDTGGTLGVAAAWTGAMGAMATATRAAPLIEQLRPSCLAMCGICAGNRDEVALGDLIIADRVYSFDHGKIRAHDGGEPEFFHDITTYNLQRAWRVTAAEFRRDLAWAEDLLPSRPPTREMQIRWLLRALHRHEHADGVAPLDHVERLAMFRVAVSGTRDWADRIVEMRQQELLTPSPSSLMLTEKGRLAAEEDLLLFPEGQPPEPAFQVHVGPLGTGNAVVEDPQIFTRLKKIGRKTLGIEMEAFAIGYVGDHLPQRSIIAKAVSDYADHDKDDRFRTFACQVSAAWLFAFLRKHLKAGPIEVSWQDGVLETSDDNGPPALFFDLFETSEGRSEIAVAERGRTTKIGDVQKRVERALAVREQGAQMFWRRGPEHIPHSLRGFLEVRPPDARYTQAYPTAIIEGTLDESLLEHFVKHIVTRYREVTPYTQARIIHTGPPLEDALYYKARANGVNIESLLELQGLLDFRPYVRQQNRALENDPIYPSSLFVQQRIEYRTGMELRVDDNALDALDGWLSHDGPQLLLVLGDFGTGKTFLMHELAARLGRRDSATVPILVELRRLEKSRSLQALLGQHFIPERGMKRFDHEAFGYMLEEGRIALLFDGFDELALRVTYAAAAEHLETVLQASIGRAKVVITSRTQHFLNDQQILQALGERVTQRGFRLLRLLPFDEGRIQQFLRNRFTEDSVARRRFELLNQVRDLLGLSHNPRMLGFIAEIDEKDLREAAKGGEITSATLYRVLLDQWLGYEVKRDHPAGMEPGLSAAARRKAATALAKLLWVREERTLSVGDIPAEILDEVGRLSERPLPREVTAFKVGSATLLSRDEEGRFSFIHQSIIEWFVANEAAEAILAEGTSSLLETAAMTDLMADFLWGLAGKPAAANWAHHVLSNPSNEVLAANANRVLRRLSRTASSHQHTQESDIVEQVVDMAGQDLRGQDFSQTSHLRGANLMGSVLANASLHGADLSNANLRNATLRGANLERAKLINADLRGADLSFVRLLGADLTNARLEGTRFDYAKLVGAIADSTDLSMTTAFGIAPINPRHYSVTVSPSTSRATSVAWYSDGELLAVGYQDGTVAIWNVTIGRALYVNRGLPGPVIRLAFNFDYSALVVTVEHHGVMTFNPITGEAPRWHGRHAAWYDNTAVSRRQSLVVIASSASVQLKSLTTGELLNSFEFAPPYFGYFQCICLSSNDELMAAGCSDHVVRVWELKTGRLLTMLKGHADAVNVVTFSSDGRILASGSDDGTIRFWDLDTWTTQRILRPRSSVRRLSFTSKNELLASVSFDNDIHLWNCQTGKLERTLQAATRVSDLEFAPSGKLLAASRTDGYVSIWRSDNGNLTTSLEGRCCGVNSLAFSMDGKNIAISSDDGEILFWDIGTSRFLPQLLEHPPSISCVAFSPNDRILASGGRDGIVRLWDLKSGQLLRMFEGHSREISRFVFSTRGEFLATASEDKSINLWGIGADEPIHSFEGLPTNAMSIDFSPDGQRLAAAVGDNIWVWDSNTGNRLPFIKGRPTRSFDLSFSPDGQILASAGDDNNVRIRNAKTGRQLRLLQGHSEWIRSIAFSYDGTVLASGSDDRTIRLWHPRTGEFLGLLEGHSHRITSVAFSPNGSLLLSASSDQSFRLWSTAAALRGDDQACLAVVVPGTRGWAAYAPDGRYKVGGDALGLLGFTIGHCRFEPGELEPYAAVFEYPPCRVADEDSLFKLDSE